MPENKDSEQELADFAKKKAGLEVKEEKGPLETIVEDAAKAARIALKYTALLLNALFQAFKAAVTLQNPFNAFIDGIYGENQNNQDRSGNDREDDKDRGDQGQETDIQRLNNLLEENKEKNQMRSPKYLKKMDLIKKKFKKCKAMVTSTKTMKNTVFLSSNIWKIKALTKRKQVNLSKT